MKRIVTLFITCVACAMSMAGNWSFSGTSYVYFDNSVTQWQGVNLYLIIGKSDYSSVYPMSIDASDTTKYFTSFPASGWGDAEYMAVIGNSDWHKGNWGYNELKNATYYTAKYEAGVNVSDKQKYLLTPQSKSNGCTIKLNWVANDFQITFADTEKNNCQRLDATNGLVTIIYSTSSKRFNTSRDNINDVYVKGSVSIWNSEDPNYRLGPWSSDGCMFRVFRISDLQRLGNSGCPEFIFHVNQKDGNSYDTRSHSSWQGGIDERLVFINNGENMCILLPGDDIEEIGQRKEEAKYIAPLSDFKDLTDSATIAHLTNFRRVPATKNLFRSYHPYKGDRPHYDTEHERLVQLAILGQQYGIRSDIALSGNEESHHGEEYECGGKKYKFAIPEYYQSIIDNKNVLYVGTANGHTPDYNTAVYRTDEQYFGEWMQEVVRFIGDHPAPFQIHCSLGADRTGAFCATLAALCGASWQQIAADYHETSNLRIQEYRHENCVLYELRLLTGEDPKNFNPTNKAGLTLAQAVAKHFIDGGYLTQEEIDRAVAKLKGSDQPTDERTAIVPSDIKKIVRNGHLVICQTNQMYDVLGRCLEWIQIGTKRFK